MRRIVMHVDEGCEAAFPGQRAASVEIELKDGRRLIHHQPTRKGDPDAPLTDAELTDKFDELAAPVIGPAGTKALLATLRRTERLTAVEVASLGSEPPT